MIGTMAPPSTQQSHQANFEERMRKLVTETETKVRQSASWSSSLTSGTSNNAGPAAIPLSAVVRQVKSLKEYTAMLKEVVVKEHDNVDAPITVVRFHSTYCPACKKAHQPTILSFGGTWHNNNNKTISNNNSNNGNEALTGSMLKPIVLISICSKL
jgi:protein-disulfide isomerase